MSNLFDIIAYQQPSLTMSQHFAHYPLTPVQVLQHNLELLRQQHQPEAAVSMPGLVAYRESSSLPHSIGMDDDLLMQLYLPCETVPGATKSRN